jgi:hypothetical protein
MILFNYYYYFLGMEAATPRTPFGLTPAIPFRGNYMEHVLISPEPFIRKCKSLAAAKNAYLDVVDGRVRLVWTGSFDDTTDFMERADAIGLGISYDMLLEALFEAGGAIDINGSYPIDDAIRQRLRRIFNKWY